MTGKQAKILSDEQVESLLWFVSTSRHSIRNRVLVLLSLKAGLRAGEIANLTWPMVLGPQDEIAAVIELRDRAAKKRSGRVIAMHPDLGNALSHWRDTAGTLAGPVIRSERGGPMTPVSIVNWFSAAYRPLVWRGVPPTRGAGRSSPGRRGSCTRPVVRCAMSSSWPVTVRSRRPSGTSTAIAMPSASLSR